MNMTPPPPAGNFEKIDDNDDDKERAPPPNPHHHRSPDETKKKRAVYHRYYSRSRQQEQTTNADSYQKKNNKKHVSFQPPFYPPNHHPHHQNHHHHHHQNHHHTHDETSLASTAEISVSSRGCPSSSFVGSNVRRSCRCQDGDIDVEQQQQQQLQQNTPLQPLRNGSHPWPSPWPLLLASDIASFDGSDLRRPSAPPDGEDHVDPLPSTAPALYKSSDDDYDDDGILFEPDTPPLGAFRVRGFQHRASSSIPTSSNDGDTNDDGGDNNIGPVSQQEDDVEESLAVAVTVHEDEEDDDVLQQQQSPFGSATLQRAEEYAPKEFPPMWWYQQRRVRRCLHLSVCLLMVAVIGCILLSLLLPSSHRAPPPAKFPTMPPTLDPIKWQYYTRLANAVGNDLMFEDGTAQQWAADWIIESDPLQLLIDNDHLIQRYVLVLFYYQLSHYGQNPWLSCNPPPSSDVVAVTSTTTPITNYSNNNDTRSTCIFMQSYLFTDYYNYTAVESFSFEAETGYYRWLSSQHECQWAGTTCDTNQVLQGINLTAQNLTGSLPLELGALSKLELLLLSFNFIQGTIPTTFGNLHHLVQLNLQHNLLTGTFSEEWYHMTALRSLNLGRNHIHGRLLPSTTSSASHENVSSSSENVSSSSTWQTSWSNLMELYVHGNELTGTLPTEIAQLSYLSYIRLDHNKLEGTIPTEWGNSLTWMESLWLSFNRLTGTIPSQLGGMTALTDLQVNDNVLHGTIPEELYHLTRLSTALDVSDQWNLTGTLSTRIGQLQHLQLFKVRHNHLVGTIPTELDMLEYLEVLWLYLNDFTGSVPSELCHHRNGLSTQRALISLDADCYPLDHPSQACSCCTSCCDRSTELCYGQ